MRTEEKAAIITTSLNYLRMNNVFKAPCSQCGKVIISQNNLFIGKVFSHLYRKHLDVAVCIVLHTPQ